MCVHGSLRQALGDNHRDIRNELFVIYNKLENH